MANSNKNVYKIGFLDEKVKERMDTFKQYYDIVCTDNASYNELKNKLLEFFKMEV